MASGEVDRSLKISSSLDTSSNEKLLRTNENWNDKRNKFRKKVNIYCCFGLGNMLQLKLLCFLVSSKRKNVP